MKKKVLCAVLAAAMVFVLAACGQNNANSNANSNANNSNNGGAQASGDTLKLGCIGPLTGGYANYGLSVQNGAKLAVEEINKNGGVGGKQLALEFQDSQGDPESAVNAYGKLMDDGMQVSLGTVFPVRWPPSRRRPGRTTSFC